MDGIQRKQLSWDYQASDLEQNGSFDHVSERASRSLQDMSDVLHDLKIIYFLTSNFPSRA